MKALSNLLREPKQDMTNVSHGIAGLLIISPTVEHTSTVIFCHVS